MNNKLSIIKNVVYGVKINEKTQEEIQLTVDVNDHHVLLNDPAFKRPDAYLHNIILAEILKSYLHLSWTKPLDDDLAVMVEEIKLSIQNKYKQIRAEELPTIFSDGIRKVYGDYMGLSIVSFEMFVIGYLESQKRKVLALNLPKDEPIRPTDEQIHLISVSNAVEAWKEYKSKGTCGRFGDVVYCFLESIGKISLSKEEKSIYWKKAKEEYERYLIVARATPVDLNERRKVENAFESFINGGQKDRLIIISRRLVVDDYFLGLGNTDIKDILSNI